MSARPALALAAILMATAGAAEARHGGHGGGGGGYTAAQSNFLATHSHYFSQNDDSGGPWVSMNGNTAIGGHISGGTSDAITGTPQPSNYCPDNTGDGTCDNNW
ncbi:MAG: hypothetical protein H6852_04280 [Geminicoccaceae bacterium]|jgi:hypothetical protein|nr:hypothetical protein [Geminicoccaceae bacterium]